MSEDLTQESLHKGLELSLEKGLAKTRKGFFSKLSRLVRGKTKVDQAFLDHLEEVLIGADIGVDTTIDLLERFQAQVAQGRYVDTSELMHYLEAAAMSLLGGVSEQKEHSFPKHAGVHACVLVGVNGVGKTTTAARLAAWYRDQGLDIVLGAGDTFRAAAAEQLLRWGERLDIPVVTPRGHSSPSAVAFETIKMAQETHKDLAIIDTAGRLHTKQSMMSELGKVCHVVGKRVGEGRYEVWLVLDSHMGQNTILQVGAFLEATPVSGLVLTKLDGTAKGGVLLEIARRFRLPIRFIGTGEQAKDIYPFDAVAYVRALFKDRMEMS